jgi:threonine/homoserine/homoserine lactone efflux protein
MSTLVYYLFGMILGAGSSVVPGPCGLTIIDAANRLGTKRAVATAIGASVGDLVYATLGVFGIGHVLARCPLLLACMFAASGAVLIVYGLSRLFSRPPARPTPAEPLGGLVVGFVTLICNPGALVTWSAVVGAQLSDVAFSDQLAAVLGIGSGSLIWFFGMAHASARGRILLGDRMHRIVQVVGSLIVVYGVLSVMRALHAG